MTKKRYRGSGCICIIYKLMLDLVFVFIIADRYRYYGYQIEGGGAKTVIAWVGVLVILPFFSRYLRQNNLREYVMVFLLLMYYIPGLSFYQFVHVDNKMYLLWNLFWIELIMLTSLKRVINCNDIPYIAGRIIGIGFVVFLCALVVYISWKYTNLRMTITFTNEYALRAEEREIVLPSLIRYLYSMAPVVISIGIGIAALRRNWFLLILGIGIQVLNFSIGGHKTILLLTIISVAIGLEWEKLYAKFGNTFLTYIFILELVCENIVYILTGKYTLTDNISRRVYFEPQILNLFYYDFFSSHHFDFYAQGPARILGISSTYDTPIANIISKIYYGTDGNANNGLFSEAYSNMGGLGCIYLPLFIVVVIFCLEICLRGKNKSVVLLFAFLCAYMWGSGNITTSLITNGLLLGALIIYVSPGLEEKGEMFDVPKDN